MSQNRGIKSANGSPGVLRKRIIIKIYSFFGQKVQSQLYMIIELDYRNNG